MEKLQKLLKECSLQKNKTVTEMNRIADALDKVEKRTTIASVASVDFLGVITKIVRLALAPVTLGVSLIVPFRGIGVAAGVTGVSAKLILSNKNHKKVKAMMEEIFIKITEIEKCLKELQEVLERLEQKSGKNINMDTAASAASIAGKTTYMAIELSRLAPLLSMSAVTVARGIRVAGVVSGVLAGIFTIVDAAFIVKGSINLHKGAKSEQAAKIREDAKTLEEVFQLLKDIVKDLENRDVQSGEAGEAESHLPLSKKMK
uniref:Apolipoprotein L3 n=1 Tax=Leptobrachium leishanense TaxID=445787 RepID=A0A8C5MB67_9ANUR